MEVTSSVWSIARSLHRAARVQRRAAARSDWDPVAIGLLNLAAQHPVRPSDAAAELDVPAQSITRSTSDLAAAGLVERVGDDADGRSYRVALTSDGTATIQRFRADLGADFARHLHGWTDDEVSDFARRLADLVTSIAEDLEDETDRPERTRNSWRTR
ncbi:MAG: MarR family winged helix-turn-helix transcriptional regulator [Pseudonocardia sp.]|nr:MarR family winged helix-turn-helix transcriptional regulator [Pseudonocardia sp.]